VMCLEGVVGREVMCLVGEPWHTVLAILLCSLLICRSKTRLNNTRGWHRWIQPNNANKNRRTKFLVSVSGVPPAEQPQARLIDSTQKAVGWVLSILLL
jgi:hypothetical protein